MTESVGFRSTVEESAGGVGGNFSMGERGGVGVWG